jgi:hypothetical protein
MNSRPMAICCCQKLSEPPQSQGQNASTCHVSNPCFPWLQQRYDDSAASLSQRMLFCCRTLARRTTEKTSSSGIYHVCAEVLPRTRRTTPLSSASPTKASLRRGTPRGGSDIRGVKGSSRFSHRNSKNREADDARWKVPPAEKSKPHLS